MDNADRSRTPRRSAAAAPDAGVLPTLWSVEELADYLGVPVNTIYKWRQTGEGPRGYRVGKYLRFAREDVAAWLATRRDGAAS
jgi:excisionase family DNA binding protein